MNQPDKDKREKDKKKRAAIPWNESTIQQWQQTIQEFNLYENGLLESVLDEDVPNDPMNEKLKTKFIINEANLVGYVLSTIELMSQCKEYSEDSFIIALRNVGELQRKKIKIMMTSFIESFKKAVPYSNELAYYTIMLEPAQLPKKSPQLFQFYLKLRKYIYNNFMSDRDQVIKQLNFDQWVSVVSKFMDNQAISQIGNRIKDHVASKKISEKVIKNNVHPFDLLIFCYELQSERTQPMKQRTIATFNPMAQENKVNQEEYQTQKSSIPASQSLAYKMIPKSPQQNQKQKSEPKNDINKAKLGQVIQMHEDLAYNYKILTNFILDAQSIVKNYVQKIKNQEPITESDIESLEQIAQFNQFLSTDPEVNLQNTEIHQFL